MAIPIRKIAQKITNRVVSIPRQLQKAPITRIAPIIKRAVTTPVKSVIPSKTKPIIQVGRSGQMKILPMSPPAITTTNPIWKFVPSATIPSISAPIRETDSFINLETQMSPSDKVAFPIAMLAAQGIGAIASGLKGGKGSGLGGLLGGRGQSQVLAVGRKYILRQMPDGRLSVSSRVPRRRFSTRARPSSFDKTMQMMMIASMMRR